ncbi:hypothetical protein D3C87_1339960 [compost metagenome]
MYIAPDQPKAAFSEKDLPYLLHLFLSILSTKLALFGHFAFGPGKRGDHLANLGEMQELRIIFGCIGAANL